MLGEALNLMFGRWVVGWIVVLVLGMIVGAACKRTTWRVLWTVGFAIVIGFVFVSSDTFQTLELARRSGSFSGRDLDAIFISSIVLWSLSFFLAVSIGGAFRKAGHARMQQEVQRLTNEQLLEAVEHALSQPQIAIMPWVAKVWGEKEGEDRRAWILSHALELRRFISDHGGIDAVGLDDFVVELQRLDRATSHE